MTHIHRVGPVGDIVRHNIRALREAHGLSLRAFVAALDAAGHPFAKNALLRSEQGSRRIDVDDLVAIAAALDVTPARLLEPPPHEAAS